MKNIQVTVYTKEHGCLDLTLEEYNNFDFDKVIYHRTDGPAVVYYYANGSIESEHYFINNQRHRIDYPALIYHYLDERSLREYYYLDHKPYTKEDYYNLINKMKALPKSLRLTHKEQWVREL